MVDLAYSRQVRRGRVGGRMRIITRGKVVDVEFGIQDARNGGEVLLRRLILCGERRCLRGQTDHHTTSGYESGEVVGNGESAIEFMARAVVCVSCRI